MSAETLTQRRARRAREAGGPRGPVSFLWGGFVTSRNTRVHGAPGSWSPLTDGRRGLSVAADVGDGVTIEGRIVDEQAEIFADPADGPALAEFPDGAEGILFSYGDGPLALQVWHQGSAWARRYAGISAYDEDPAWRVPAELVAVPPGRTVTVTHHRDPRPVEMPAVVEARFVVDGARHALLGSADRGGGGVRFLFRDGTSGAGSYASGRTLRVAWDGEERATVLDFNEASLLPCAFSLAWNCPLPPEENVLPVAVRVGERHAIDHDGEPLL